jgi:cellobiose epimerase
MNQTIPHTTLTLLLDFRESMKQELTDILDYWMQYTPDKINGGFAGKITHQNIIDEKAAKGSVLNSRILWAFSAAYNLTGNKAYQQMAARAYEYFTAHFTDEKFGGIYWSVDYQGNPLDTKKQTYATAFGLYALAEYEKCSEDPEVMEEAKMLYLDIINHTSDIFRGGYYEAFARDWSELADSRLSAKDANEKKSMNTHLHVIEAFANLYTIWPDEKLRKSIEELLDLFADYIINKKDHHLFLFFGEDWAVKSGTISYGHDIEAAWLLQECAVIIKDEKYIEQFKKLAVQMVLSTAEGLDADGGLWYEFEPATNHLIKQKHSWPQAEAMIGFLNAWQFSGDDKFLQYSLNAWNFTRQYIKDKQRGEWVWGVNEDYSIMDKEDKVGFWKCPYHNSRACIEIIKRINNI